MGLLVDKGDDQGRARGSAGPADPLQIAGCIRGYGTKYRAGKIADVDAHLQGAGAGQDVGIIGMLHMGKVTFQLFPLGRAQKACVLLRHNPAKRSFSVTVLIIQLARGKTLSSVASPVGIIFHAGRIVPYTGLCLGPDHRSSALGADQMRSARVKDRRFIRNNVPAFKPS